MELIGCVHDALVIESSIEKIDEDVAITRECMRRASRIVLNSEHELRTDATIVSVSNGRIERRSITSASIFSSLANRSATFKRRFTCRP